MPVSFGKKAIRIIRIAALCLLVLSFAGCYLGPSPYIALLAEQTTEEPTELLPTDTAEPTPLPVTDTPAS